jgi:LAO/AO transport system ATPase
MSDDLGERFRQHDRLALSRLLTLLARGTRLDQLLPGLPPAARPSRVVAVTGSAGVGKSTLIGRLIEQIRHEGLSVAVLACDPESPLSGGALLGDRQRMPSRPEDDKVFIRSLAAASGHGAVAEHLGPMIRLLEAFKFDVILLETVGAGQGDTAVHHLADVVLLLLQPETGDDLQWEKAGVLEIADLIAVHKADLPRAEQVEAQVRTILGLSGELAVPVLCVSAKTGQGIDQLWKEIAAQPLRRGQRAQEGRHLLYRAQELLAQRYVAARAGGRNGVETLLGRWQRGELDEDAAAEALLDLLRPAP